MEKVAHADRVGQKRPTATLASAPAGAFSVMGKACHRSQYHPGVTQASKLTKSALERLEAAQRIRGLFADIAPSRSLVDELIANSRAEAEAEDREGNTAVAVVPEAKTAGDPGASTETP